MSAVLSIGKRTGHLTLAVRLEAAAVAVAITDPL